MLLYEKIARDVEDDILSGLLRGGEVVPSTNQLAGHYGINPATAGKGLNLLLRDGILVVRRGVGMFVTEGAREVILNRRREEFRARFLEPLLEEAQRLGINRRDVMAMIAAAD